MKMCASKIIKKNTISEVADCAYSYINSKSVAISGGSTYEKILNEWAKKFSFSTVDFYPVDERAVPINSEFSNWGAASSIFFEKLAGNNSIQNFASSLEVYKKIIDKKINEGNGILETIFLGVGDDGHTASLFPDGDYLNDMVSTVLATKSPKKPENRFTIAPKLIIEAKTVVLIVIGEGKKDIYERIKSDDLSLPIVKLLSQREKNIIITDLD